MAARVESPCKRLFPWLVVAVVLAGGGAGGYWWLTHKKDAPPPPAGNDNKTPGEVRSDPVAVVTPEKKDDHESPVLSVKAAPRDSKLADEEDATLLPPDALAFASVRVTDVVNSEAGKEFMLTIEISDKSFFADLEKWIGVPLVQIDRLIFFMPKIERELVNVRSFLDSFGKQGRPPQFEDGDQMPVTVVRTIAPYDRARVSAQVVPGGIEKSYKGKTLLTAGPRGDALHFVSDHLYVRGPAPVVEAFLDLPVTSGSGPARKALNAPERKLASLYVNTGFYVPLLTSVVSRHADKLSAVLREMRTDKEIEALLGKEYLDALETNLVERARKEPEKLVRSLVEHLLDRVVKEQPAQKPYVPGTFSSVLSQWQPALNPYRPLLSAQTIMLDTDLSGVWKLDLNLIFHTKEQARAARPSMEAGRQFFQQLWRKEFAILEKTAQSPSARADLKIFAWLGEMLDKELAFDVEGTHAHAGVRTKSENFGTVMATAAQRVRDSANQAVSQNNLKQIALAMQDYTNAHSNLLPPPALYDKAGKPLLSWRVAILPYIEQQDLYKQFHLDEPWDSPHNKKLLDRMPKIYAPAGNKQPGFSLTYYQVFTGPGTAFPAGRGPNGLPFPASISDGTSNTILAVEAGTPVPWTKPEDIPFAPNKPLPKLGGLKFRDGFHAGMFDGSVHFIRYTISEKTLKAAITANGGEVLGKDW